jgi:hypothetical protein
MVLRSKYQNYKSQIPKKLTWVCYHKSDDIMFCFLSGDKALPHYDESHSNSKTFCQYSPCLLGLPFKSLSDSAKCKTGWVQWAQRGPQMVDLQAKVCVRNMSYKNCKIYFNVL